jgi:colanic acid/amylovoran biosynthesis glycosyltransferase
MLTVAYLANQFPSSVEPYVTEEILELRRRGVRVIAGSVRKPRTFSAARCVPEVALQPLSAITLLQAMGLLVRRWGRIRPLIVRIIFRGREGPWQRVKALAHTCLGAAYAVLLERRGVGHIHVHHGYFGSWIAMVAARLLGVGFSVTLHGSDLLLHGVYLDAKLENCDFCLTVSEYNRRYILERYPEVDAEKVVVARLGVDGSERTMLPVRRVKTSESFQILAVGRLHAVKDHAFLVRACARLQDLDVPFECSIAGDGPERRNLERLIRECCLGGRVSLLGSVAREKMVSHYDRADVVVLTSRSEGIPLVLMEAMARGRIVLAPEITGIPELVTSGQTGFLYQSGSLDAFVARLLFVRSLLQARSNPDRHPDIPQAARQLDWIRHAAQVQVRHNFNRNKNLESFGDLFLDRVAPQTGSIAHENLVLQQI